MATRKRNEFLDIPSDDEDASDRGYDSEAAEESKGRIAKRRRMQTQTDDVSGSEDEADGSDIERDEKDADKNADETSNGQYLEVAETEEPSKKQKKKPLDPSKAKKKKKPGIVYLSTVPPYLKPFALKSMLEKRGFSPITKVFLAPLVRSDSAPRRSNKRKTYGEGWVEFASKKTAKVAAEALNASILGGSKGNYYHDDLLNMKYLRGMSWDDLMAQINNEKREREARRRAEDIRARKEEKVFIEGVEKGKVLSGMEKKNEEKRKRKMAEADAAAAADPPAANLKVRRTFKQNEVKVGRDKIKDEGAVGEDTKRVLGKIF